MPLLFFQLSALVNALLSLILGLIILSQKRTPVQLRFFSFLAAFFVWSSSYFLWLISEDSVMALYWCRMLTFGSIFIPITFWHFVITFIGEEKKWKKLAFFAYGTAIILFFANFSDLLVRSVEPRLMFPFWPVPGIAYHFKLFIFGSFFIHSFYLLLKHFRLSVSTKKEQIKFFLYGCFVSIFGGITNFLLWYDIPIPPYGNPLSVVVVIAAAYAIIRHRFLDMRMVLRNSFVFFGSVFILLLPFLSINLFLLSYPPVVWYWSNALLLVFILFIYPTIKDYSNKIANRYFFSSIYDPREIISYLGNQLRSTLDSGSIYKCLDRVFIRYMRVSSYAYYSYDNNKDVYVLRYNQGLNANNASIGKIDNFDPPTSKTVISIEELETSYKKGYKKLINDLSLIGGMIIVVIRTKQEKIGIIVLGRKESGDSFGGQDEQTIEIVSRLIATALENAMLYENTKEQNIHLNELLEMKQDFLRVINHQLNTPVSIIRMSLDSIRDNSIPMEKGLSFAQSGIDKISDILDDFWLAYQIEGESVHLQKEKVDIFEMIKGIVEECSKLDIVRVRKLEISIEAPKFPLPKIDCDRLKISHVITCILRNAVNFTLRGGVRISFKKFKSRNQVFLKIIIADSGQGISEEDKKIIFQKFMRGASASKIHPDGSGLGLYIARKVIEASGGKIKIEETRPGIGSTISLTLPI